MASVWRLTDGRTDGQTGREERRPDDVLTNCVAEEVRHSGTAEPETGRGQRLRSQGNKQLPANPSDPREDGKHILVIPSRTLKDLTPVAPF